MPKFLMICYVAADFGPFNGEIFSIKANQIGVFIEAPEWIKETLMFKWLLRDGSIRVADETITRLQGENDPMAGISAEGKDIEVTKEAEPEEPVEEQAEPVEEKPKKTRRKTTKDDAK